MNRELRQVLRTGPFEVALDAAIEASGLTLERLRSRLADCGVTVSRTAISYWRTGRSRPERDESLAALAGLEQVLGLPSASLVALLGGRRPRGRTPGRQAGTLSRRSLWPSCGGLLAGLETASEGSWSSSASATPTASMRTPESAGSGPGWCCGPPPTAWTATPCATRSTTRRIPPLSWSASPTPASAGCAATPPAGRWWRSSCSTDRSTAASTP
ncbi:hypothetical protein ACFQV2_24925 [Actinokineospora soli]|uniref:XRE family transcriptional regulator n=1 Tax=Actinokineospora soli TaxID=1048753 RepID=A0ABW2TTW3_9PSEU